MVAGEWIVACVGDANTRGCGLGWVNIARIDEVMVLIRVIRIVVKSENKSIRLF